MPFFTKQQRKTWRKRRTQRRISRLAEVPTTPARQATGAVLSIMLTSKPDPQRGEKIGVDYATYLRPWWTTVNRVGLKGVVLHDGLPDEFVHATTTEHVRFHRVEPGEWPILHDRHRLMRDFLRDSQESQVFLTDISDVAFKRDPFALIRSDLGKHRLFLGSEPTSIGQSRCLRQEVIEQFGYLLHEERQVINPGILGGLRKDVLELLDQIVECIAKQSRLVNSDMSIVNRVVHDNYAPSELFTGLPLHSRFKGWQYHSPAAILHK